MSSDYHTFKSHLVESDNNLLVFLDYTITHGRLENHFGVYKLKWEEFKVKLVEVYDLGDKALFLGHCHPFSLTRSIVVGYSGNSISSINFGYDEYNFCEKDFSIHNYCIEKTTSNLEEGARLYPEADPKVGWA